MASATRLSRSRSSRLNWRSFDFPLLLAAGLLFLLGCGALFSVGLRTGDNFLRRHLLMAALGVIPFGVFYFVKPGWWRKASWTLYGLNLLILAAVLYTGSTTNGAQRWLDLKFMQFQPSELAKMMTVVTLAAFLSARRDSIQKLSTFLLSFLHVAAPAFLIARQPHYGGALTLIVIWLCVCLAGNVPARYLVGALCFIVVGGVAATRIPGALHDYHLKRLEAMGKSDRSRMNFQQDRAQIALGLGGLSGSGLFKGRQRVPEQENDFIFTVVGEDAGLLGGGLALGAFGLLFYRIWLVMVRMSDPYPKMIAAGILGLLAFHTLVNLGMVLQLLPVVGLWLPFFSAGGTALWLCMACVGILLRIGNDEANRVA